MSSDQVRENDISSPEASISDVDAAFIHVEAPGLHRPDGVPDHSAAVCPIGCDRPYHAALARFKSILRERRVQISSHEKLPNLPGQALYLARNEMISAYKDLTDAQPSRIGRPNKFGIPPAYYDADNEPLSDEYKALFRIMQAPPRNAQASETPDRDVVELGTAIGRAVGLDAANAAIAGRISWAFSLLKPMAIRTSATHDRTATREFSRPA